MNAVDFGPSGKALFDLLNTNNNVINQAEIEIHHAEIRTHNGPGPDK